MQTYLILRWLNSPVTDFILRMKISISLGLYSYSVFTMAYIGIQLNKYMAH